MTKLVDIQGKTFSVGDDKTVFDITILEGFNGSAGGKLVDDKISLSEGKYASPKFRALFILVGSAVVHKCETLYFLECARNPGYRTDKVAQNLALE